MSGCRMMSGARGFRGSHSNSLLAQKSAVRRRAALRQKGGRRRRCVAPGLATSGYELE